MTRDFIIPAATEECELTIDPKALRPALTMDLSAYKEQARYARYASKLHEIRLKETVRPLCGRAPIKPGIYSLDQFLDA